MAKKRVGVGLGVPRGVTLKPVPGCGGLYEAGDDGNVYCHSNARRNARLPKPFRLSTSCFKGGYPLVSVVLNGVRKSKAVHTLVCMAFHGERPSPIHETRHLDGDRKNSCPSNLAWGTPAENEADKRRHGRVPYGKKHPSAKLSDDAVRILRTSIPRGLWNAVDAAKVFGVDEATIRNIVRGRGWRHVT